MAKKDSRAPCPRTIRIFGRTYTINIERANGLGQDRIGSCDNINQIITADALQSPIEKADTILHEVLHAIVWTMKIQIEGDQEEAVVSALATGLLGVFQDNPEFVRFLSENKSAHLQGVFDGS